MSVSRFVARLLDGEKMAVVCREFDISRQTGYKIFQRYKDCGIDGLTDRSRRPYRHASRLPFQVEKFYRIEITSHRGIAHVARDSASISLRSSFTLTSR